VGKPNIQKEVQYKVDVEQAIHMAGIGSYADNPDRCLSRIKTTPALSSSLDIFPRKSPTPDMQDKAQVALPVLGVCRLNVRCEKFCHGSPQGELPLPSPRCTMQE
jgi:hypothetical protein